MAWNLLSNKPLINDKNYFDMTSLSFEAEKMHHSLPTYIEITLEGLLLFQPYNNYLYILYEDVFGIISRKPSFQQGPKWNDIWRPT